MESSAVEKRDDIDLVPPSPPPELLQAWTEDGTPKVSVGETCDKSAKRRLRGPMVLSKEKGAVVMGFGLSYHSMFEVVKEVEAAEEEAITDTIEIEYRAAAAAAATAAATAAGETHKKKKGRGAVEGPSGGGDLPLPLTARYPLTLEQRARAGALVDERFGDRKCYCERVSRRHGREGRLEEQNGQALAARRAMVRSHRQEQDRLREVELQLLCNRNGYSVHDGNYCSWWFDEYLFAEYLGATKDGRPHGHGFKRWASGCFYVGEWQLGAEQTTKPGEVSTFVWPDGLCVYEGTFHKGKRHGRGLKTWHRSPAAAASSVSESLHKESGGTAGRHKDSGGGGGGGGGAGGEGAGGGGGGREFYDGEFARGLEHGLGKRVYRDGAVFEGRFRYGVRDGPGCLTRPDGRKEKGSFKDPVLDEVAEFPVPPAPLQEFETSDLLSLATRALARCVAEQPDLYPAQLLQQTLPAERKPLVAATFVDLVTGSGAGSSPKKSSDAGGGGVLSPAFVKLVPSIAWRDLDVMSLSGLKMNKRDLSVFIYFLETNTTIVELKLPACGIDASSCAVFGKILGKPNTRVQTLDLSWNNIGRTGAHSLANVLGRGGCKAVTTMKLAGCNVGSAGAEFLADMLLRNTTLTVLDLPYNDIGPLGAASLGEVVNKNSTLQQLDVRSNAMGPSGGQALAKGLLHNTGALKVVKVADNQVGEAVAAQLASCMRGTALPGLDSFAHRHLKGPHSVSGTLYGRKPSDARRKKKQQDEEEKQSGGQEGQPLLGGVKAQGGGLEKGERGAAAAAAAVQTSEGKQLTKGQNGVKARSDHKTPPKMPGLRLVHGL